MVNTANLQRRGTAMQHARILSTGSGLPERIVRNEDLTQFPRHTLGLIEEKTGVRERRFADPSQCTSDIAALAASACLKRIGFDPLRVDAIILATSSPDRIQPATATRLQQLIGAANAFCFDINSVCSGGVYALALAESMIRAARCATVLVVASEVYSRILNPADFSTYPYFGDGAGAVLLGAGDAGPEVVGAVLRTDGAGADVIQIPAGGTMLPFHQLQQPKDAFFRMKGREVFDFAVDKGSRVIGELLASTGTPRESIRWVIPHQANLKIIAELSQRCGIPLHKFVINLDRYGNTAGASVLIAFDELCGSGEPRPGDHVVLVAFGGGLSWGAALITM